ncbi:BTAD domain-containing putative transcriptional regulator [Actinomadura sp. SCN-SB]|uniref:AfsR/SARP family transcriptional regulator n=1 Tax=Actinomadura sp. SCN-SB TaxID=3373092 RepID=UPI00374FE44B
MVATSESDLGAFPGLPRLRLLGGFVLEVAAQPVTLPRHAQRVLAFLSLNSRGRALCPRGTLAERLWVDSTTARSHASLRTALWRIRQADSRLLRTGGGAVRLGDQVWVDLYCGLAWAERLLAADELAPGDVQVSELAGDLLPNWDDDWLIMQREQIRQLRVHALDALAHRLLLLGRHAQAITVALAAVDAEPLRESAQATLIDIYLAERNVSEAVRQYDRYADLLRSELGLAPSRELSVRIPRRLRVPVHR